MSPQARRRWPREARLFRLRLLAMGSELSADPCTTERAMRGQRADRIAAAWRAVRLQAWGRVAA
jgi:hypothetical protein